MQFKITHKIYLITLLPIALVLYMSSQNVIKSYQDNAASQKLLEFSLFTKNATELLRDFKSERDLGQLYLAGDINTTVLRKQFQTTDQTIKLFLRSKKQINPLHKHNDLHNGEIENIREKMLSKNLVPHQIQSFYALLNSQIMTLIQKQNIKSTNYKVNQDALALKKLATLQELAREERTLFTQVVHDQDLILDTIHTIQANNAQQNRIFQDFLHTIDNDNYRNVIHTIFHSSTKDNIREYRRKLQEELYKMRLLAKMRAIIGYGGLIHSFKNYVLRKEQKYYDLFAQQHTTFLDILSAYQAYAFDNQREYTNLLIIEETMNHYYINLKKIRKELANADSKTIDNQVRIHDTLALEALDALQNSFIGINVKEWIQISTIYQEELQTFQEFILSDLTKALNHLQKNSDKNFYTQLLLNILFILILFMMATFIGRGILKNLKRLQNALHNFFSYLNFERDQPQEIKLSSNDELNEMANDINAQLATIHKHREEDEDFISETTHIVKMMKEGDFGEKIYFKPFNPSLISLSSVFNDLVSIIQDKIKAQTDELESMNATLSDQVYQQTLELHNQLQKLQQFQFAIDESAMVTHSNPDGTLYEYNRLFAKTAKLDNTILGDSSALLLSPKSRDKKIEEISSFITHKKVYKGILEMQTAQGKVFYTNSTIIPIQDTHENIVDILGLHYDITPVIKARDEAIEAERSKDEFLSNMSHEIRTPLNAILGFVTILQKRLEDEKSLHYLDIISKSGQSLLHIINDILDFSKIQSGKFTITPHSFEAFDEFSSAVKLFASKAYEKKINLYFYIDAKIPESLNADAIRIKQILSNLLSNAIKFTPENGTIKIKINYADNNLQINVQDSGIGISAEHQKRIFNAFEQADGSTTREYGGTGLGLSISSKLAALMQGELSIKSEPGHGSLFSLSIPVSVTDECSRPQFQTSKIDNLKITLIQLEPNDESALKLIGKYFDDYSVRYTKADTLDNLDGDIAIICEHKDAIAHMIANEKTAIILETLPEHHYDNYPHIYTIAAPFVPFDVMRVLDEATVEVLEGTTVINQEAQALKFQAHILIAEDNKTNQMLIKLLMDDYGITYDMANDGIEAVSAYKNSRNYDLVLTDENMPNLNGMGAMQQMRSFDAENNFASIPIVVLTASVLESDRERFFKEGMDDFVGKPIDEQELQKVLQKYLTTL
ncbi:MAG: ATP-binding protein [Campylobacterota bacterium]|nr:ATP-binding protein [Campylobacterota bacterium]